MGRDEIEERLSRLDSQTNLSTQLRFALDYISSDPHSSLTKSRVVLEKIVHDLFLSEMGCEPRKPILGDMLANKQFARRIDRRILSRMHSIRDMANLGPHGEFVTEKDAIRVLDDLSEVLDWYVGRCQEGRPSGLDRALVRESAPELITKEITGITRRPEPKRRASRKPGLWLVLAPVLLGGVAAAVYFLFIAGNEERRDQVPGHAEVAPPSLSSPDDAEHFSSAPVALRWAGPAGHEKGTFEVEVVRLKGTESGTTTRASVPLEYVLWPWESGDPAPGTYSWRVRVGGSEQASWSEARTFAYYRTALDRVQGEKRLRVGAETTYHPPFVQYDVESKAVAGFDVELARELARQLAVEHEHVAVPWDELFESVDQGNVDLVISAVTVTPERSKRFAFSRPYFTTWQRMTVRADTTRSDFGPDSPPFVVGTQKGTTAATTAAKVAGATVKLYDTLDLAIVALSTKEIDVLISDEVFSPARHDRNFKLIGERLTREDYGVMLRIGEAELLARVNAVIDDLATRGWLEAARARHDLNETPPSTPDAGVAEPENQ